MISIHVKKFGFACGTTGAILYVGCVIVMASIGRNGTIQFFNTLLHGLDTSSIILMNVSVSGALMGVAEAFIISWMAGACIAAIYNLLNTTPDKSTPDK